MSRETVDLTKTNKKNLRIARENVGYTTREATDRICGKKTKADRVKEWEETVSNPTWGQLDKMSDIYNINMFLLTSSKTLRTNRDIRDFRIAGDSINRAQVKRFPHFLLRRQIFLEYIMKEDKVGKNKLVGSGSKYRRNPEKLAEHISEKIGYRAEDIVSKRHPLKHFISLVEGADIFVMKTLASDPMGIEEMRGVYMASEYAPVIGINRRDAKTAQMSALAHELAHLFINTEGISNIDFRTVSRSEPVEQFCHTVAAHLLLPERILEDTHYSLHDIMNLAEKYKVDELFAFSRLRDAGRIRASDEKAFEKKIIRRMEQQLQERRTKGERGSYVSKMKETNGGLYTTFISSLYFEGRLNAAEAGNAMLICITDAV